MQTFWQWLANLQETHFGLDPNQYNRLFDQELGEGHRQNIRPRPPPSP